MNKKNEKPYLEFGGNAFYINLESILDVIKIDTIDNKTEIIQEPVITTKKKTSKKSELNKEEKNTDLDINVKSEVDFLIDQNQGVQVDITKWEILRLMIDAIMNINTDIDDKLGMAGLNNNTSIPFKIAFNTLLKYDILQEEE